MSTLRIVPVSPEEEMLLEEHEMAVSRLARKFKAGFEVLLSDEAAAVLAKMAYKHMEDEG